MKLCLLIDPSNSLLLYRRSSRDKKRRTASLLNVRSNPAPHIHRHFILEFDGDRHIVRRRKLSDTLDFQPTHPPTLSSSSFTDTVSFCYLDEAGDIIGTGCRIICNRQRRPATMVDGGKVTSRAVCQRPLARSGQQDYLKSPTDNRRGMVCRIEVCKMNGGSV